MDAFDIGVRDGMTKAAMLLPGMNMSPSQKKRAVESVEETGKVLKSAWQGAKKDWLKRKPPKSAGFLRKARWLVVGT